MSRIILHHTLLIKQIVENLTKELKVSFTHIHGIK